MGCDIHLFSETRKAGVWTCDQADGVTRESEDYGSGPEERLEMSDMYEHSGRDYWLFGFLNKGVRSEFDWSFPYRDEFPDDASELLAELKSQEGEDAHSASFFSRAELLDKHEELKLKRAEYLIAPPAQTHWAEVLAHHITCLEGLIGALDAAVPAADQRIVFWFDN